MDIFHRLYRAWITKSNSSYKNLMFTYNFYINKEGGNMFKDSVIYYMSGTGNSYRVGKWIEELISRKNKANLIKIEAANPEKEIKDSPDMLVGIVMPTHAFTTPWQMTKFLFKLPRTKNVTAFCIATRAGLKFGNIFTPGMSGSATFLAALILRLKGYYVAGAAAIDMPSNWISFHPGLTPEASKAIIKRADIKTEKFIKGLLAGRKMWYSMNNLYEIICAILLLPVSILFLLIGRFYLAKIFFANNDCNRCGICVKNCPVKAVVFKGKDKWPYWRYNCESCMRCMAFCPERAIEASHSWAVILYFILTTPVAYYAIAHFSFLSDISGFTAFMANIIYVYMALFLSYMIFNYLTRIPIINTFFTYTTLTHFFRRYHEPDTKLSDIAGKK